jgi:hypothetical protein
MTWVSRSTFLRHPARRWGRTSALLLAVALLLAGVALQPGAGPSRAAEAPEIQVSRRAADGVRIYRAERGDCAVEWVVREAEPGVVLHRPRCAAALAEQAPLIQAAAEAFAREDPAAGAWHTLVWGRLAPDGPSDAPPTMALRLALAAHRSTGWDPRLGQPKAGDINRFVRDLADAAGIYPELKAICGNLGRDIRFAAAEKVLVQKAGDLPFYDRLLPHGVGPADKLPFDCQAWFAVGLR